MKEPQEIESIVHDVLSELRLLNQNVQKMAEKDKVKEMTDPILSIGEAAEYCNVTRQTIAAWIQRGRLKKVARGCKVGLLQSTLDYYKR